MTDWKPLPSYWTSAAPDVQVAALDRIRSMAALRTLIALHCIAGLSTVEQDPHYPTAVASITDLVTASGLARSSVQKGVNELREAMLIGVTPWEGARPQLPRAFTMLPIKDMEVDG